MSLRHVSLPSLDLTVGVASGVVTERAYNASLERALADGNCLAGADLLLLVAAGSRFEGVDLASLARVIGRIRTQAVTVGRSRLRAAVLAPDPAVDWFPQLFAALWTHADGGDGDCRVAASLEDALAWLGHAGQVQVIERAIVAAMLTP